MAGFQRGTITGDAILAPLSSTPKSIWRNEVAYCHWKLHENVLGKQAFLQRGETNKYLYISDWVVNVCLWWQYWFGWCREQQLLSRLVSMCSHSSDLSSPLLMRLARMLLSFYVSYLAALPFPKLNIYFIYLSIANGLFLSGLHN